MRRFLSNNNNDNSDDHRSFPKGWDGRYDRTAFAGLKGRDYLDIMDYKPEELKALLDAAHCLKKMYKEDGYFGHRPFTGKSIGMVFQKRSTRTRMSTEVAFNMLGGHAVFLGVNDIHLGVEESTGDTARVLSTMNDVILARVFEHEDIVEMANASKVPVINALSNLHHPLQALADYMILQEEFRHDLSGLKVAWVGDGNNVCHSLALLGMNLGCHIQISTPPGYEPNQTIMDHARKVAKNTCGKLILCNDPLVACKEANVIATDTWVSMGNETQQIQRLKDFAGYQVTEKMGKVAAPDWKFLHCLPRKKYEVDDEVFRGPRSVVWREAENRIWSVMSVCLALLRGKI